MTPQRFADALVERIRPLLPDGFALRADGDHVCVTPPEGPGTSTSLGHLDPADAEPEDYADAAWNVLSMVQDAVSEQLDDPWPAGAGQGDDLLDPGTRAAGTVIHLWFGDEAQPARTLPPIALE